MPKETMVLYWLRFRLAIIWSTWRHYSETDLPTNSYSDSLNSESHSARFFRYILHDLETRFPRHVPTATPTSATDNENA